MPRFASDYFGQPSGLEFSGAAQTANMRRSLDRQLAQARDLDVRDEARDKAQGGPSILSRVFDVLSRGNYAVAEGTRRQFDEDGAGVGDFVTGFLSGLSGKSKTGFADVLEEAGVENKIVRGVGGFAGDVLLDPLNLFSGGTIGGVRAIGKETAEQVAARSLAASLKHGDALKDAVKAGEHAAELSRAEKIANRTMEARQAMAEGRPRPRGPRPSSRPSRYEVRKHKQAAIQEVVGEHKRIAKELSDAAAESGRFQLRYGTKNHNVGLLPDAMQQYLYKKGVATSDFLKETQVGGALYKSFSNRAKYAGRIHQLQRHHEGSALAMAAETAMKYKTAFNKLTDEQATIVTRALDAGDISHLTGVERQAAEEAQKLFRQLAEDEVSFGLLEANQIMDNYVPYILKRQPSRAEKAKLREFVRPTAKVSPVGSTEFSPGLRRRSLSLDDIADKQPITDIRELVARRVYKHYSKTGQLQFHDQIVNDYGLLIPKDISTIKELKPGNKYPNVIKTKKEQQLELLGMTPAQLKKEGYVNVSDDLKQMGLKPDKDGMDIFLPENIAKSIKETIKLNNNEDEWKFFKDFMTKTTSAWKTLATTVNPGFHVRNAYGDMWLNYIAGVKDPTLYEKSLRLMGGREENIPFRLISGEASTEINANHIIKAFRESGLGAGFLRLDVGPVSKNLAGLGDTAAGKAFKRYEEFMRKGGDRREQWTRLTNFMHQYREAASDLVKNGKYTVDDITSEAAIKEITERAATMVRKHNIDYGDLTEFEKKLKNYVPFYTFMRKNFPIQLEALLTQPGKVNKLPKLQRNINTLLGSDRDYQYADEDIPQWMREQGTMIRFGGNKAILPDVPFNTAFNQFEGGPQGILAELISSLNPAIGQAVETATGRSLLTGGERSDSVVQNFTGFTPPTRVAANLIRSVSANADEDDENDVNVAQQLLNYLLGAGYRPIETRSARGELRRQEDIIQGILKRRREELGL